MCQDTEAKHSLGITKWRQRRSKYSQAKADQTKSTTLSDSDGSSPHPQTTNANSKRTLSATLLLFLRGGFGLKNFHLHNTQQKSKKNIYAHTHTGDEQHCRLVLSSTFSSVTKSGPFGPETQQQDNTHNGNNNNKSKSADVDSAA